MSGALDDIFQSIYSSVVEAQNTIESHYLGEIVDDYFEKDGTPKVIIVKLPGQDGKLKDVHIPAISLVPHQGILIDEVEVEMKVKLSGSKELATIRVKFRGEQPPEGLARIKDNLIKVIPT